MGMAWLRPPASSGSHEIWAHPDREARIVVAGKDSHAVPAGTLRVKGATYCASIKGMLFEPCFNLNRIDERSFRGSLAGMGFAYCDFTRRTNIADMSPRRHSSEPLSLESTDGAGR